MVMDSLLTSAIHIPAVLFKSECDFYILRKHLREKEQALTPQINIIQTPSTFISLITRTTTPNLAIKLCCLSASHMPAKLALLSSKGNTTDKVEYCLPPVDISRATSPRVCLLCIDKKCRGSWSDGIPLGNHDDSQQNSLEHSTILINRRRMTINVRTVCFIFLYMERKRGGKAKARVGCWLLPRLRVKAVPALPKSVVLNPWVMTPLGIEQSFHRKHRGLHDNP